jgi:uncharacterized protein (DUF305 family)
MSAPHDIRLKAAVLAMVLAGTAPLLAETFEEAAFLAENGAAMNKMMADMQIKPSGDADRDFVALMIPHHEGAVAMARAELRHGRNEQLRRLAQEIIVSQSQEIAVMRLAVAQPAAPSAASPVETRSPRDHSHVMEEWR